MESEITIQNIDRVLAFLPLFEQQDTKLYELKFDRGFDPYVYADGVDNFIQTLYNNRFVIPSDWTEWKKECSRYVEHPDQIALADIATLQKLLTSHVRAERFCSGHLAGVIGSGHILAILRRLATIRAEMMTANINQA